MLGKFLLMTVLLLCSTLSSLVYASVIENAILTSTDKQPESLPDFNSLIKTTKPQQVNSLSLQANTGYWLLVDLNSIDKSEDQVLYLDGTKVDIIDYRLLDSRFELLSSSHLHSAFVNKITPYSVLDANSQWRWAAVYLKHNKNTQIEINIIPEQAFYQLVKQQLFTIATLAVLLVVAMAISGAFYFLSRHIKFIYLFSYLLSVLVGMLISKGLLAFVTPSMPLSVALKSSATCFIAALAFACMFVMRSSYGSRGIIIAHIRLPVLLLAIFTCSIIASILPYELATYLLVAGFTIETAILIFLYMQWKETHPSYSGIYVLAWYLIIGQAVLWQLTLLFPNSLALVNDTLIVFNACVFVGAVLIQDRSRIVQYNYSLLHDDETKLPNKKLLFKCLQSKIKLSESHSIILFRPAILLDVRANFGYEHANEQIKITMAKLAHQLSVMNAAKVEATKLHRHYIARLDDSTYAFVANGVLELSQIEQFVCVTTAVFAEGISHNSNHFVNKVDIGVANYPLHAASAEQLIQCGLQALSVKPLHGERWHMYDAQHSSMTQYRLEVASSLKEAIEENQLSLFFQPQICLATGKVHGAEALLRWQHPRLGHVPPDEFIPIAESSGMIFELTEWVVEQALAYQQQLQVINPDHIISINISAKDLLRKELPVLFLTLLNEYQINAANVMLELTESATLSDGVNIKTALNDYRLIGLKIAIDDFGTGYSSLAYLSKMGFDEIKIDKQFVMNIEYSKNDQTICRATCDIAASLGSYVVAEGIEDIQSLKRLKSFGCEIGQGYYFSRPLAFTDYLTWLENNLQTHTKADVYQLN
nr:EAL domain-containing protein [Pseudoalteromonas shioyasakiensis]